jgi:serine/threonine protein kinase
MTGQTLGPYEILAKLGEGGMGEVFLAADKRLNRRVAIKVLLPGARDEDEARRRMLHEARMAATIDHPNACTLYEIGADGDRPYIVMQYVEGETLLARMRRGRLGLREVVDVASQIAAALSEAHGRGVVHRDIKPGNIMIGSGGLVKVLDFGLAKPCAGPTWDTQSAIASYGMVAGTTPYMSPEQIRAEPLDGRSDIFSLGVVLYELVAGTRPFDRTTGAATMAAILTEDPPPLAGPLQAVVARALAKPLAQRFASATELRDALLAANTDSAETAPARRHEPPAQKSVNLEAEKLYLRGRLLWNKRHPDALRQAIASFQESVEQDPHYAKAYAGLADAYLLLGFIQALPPSEIVPKARAAARRAIELDAALAEPHASLGYLAGMFDWDRDTSTHEMAEAMRLDPGYAWAPHWYGLLAAAWSLDEAMIHVRRARDLDPLSPITNAAVGIPLHLHRRYQEAVMVYSNVLQSEAGFAPAHYYIGMSYEQLGDFGKAIEHLDRAGAISGRTAIFVGALGHCLGTSGQHDAARALLGELEGRSRERYVSPFNVMLIHLGLGETEQALVHFELALAERNAWLWMTPVEPRFDPLRGDPRFRAAVARHGLRSEP